MQELKYSKSPRVILEYGSSKKINKTINAKLINNNKALFIIDHYFKNKKLPFKKKKNYIFIFYKSIEEPSVDYINNIITKLRDKKILKSISLIVGFGGGSCLDIAKAVSIGLTNNKPIQFYQGWDIPKNKPIYKIAIPTIAGTGSESTRTCVLINKEKNIKLGINSDFSIYDEVILDPDLTNSVSKNQYFYTAMDAFIHSFESLSGRYRNILSDYYATMVINLIDEIFTSKNIKSKTNRKKLMLCSYLGGLSIASSYVGIVHPLSAGLSTVFGTRHCEANCRVLFELNKYYPSYRKLFLKYVINNKIKFHKLNYRINDNILTDLYQSSIFHNKPLANALGKNFKKILTYKEVSNIFKKILNN